MKAIVRGTVLVMGSLATIALIAACGGDSGNGSSDAPVAADRGVPVAEVGQLAIYGPYVPAPPTDIAALYFVVVNSGNEADRLVGISSDVSGNAMLHQTVVEGDTARMTPVEGGVEIPAGGELVLEPGGYHVMLMNLARSLTIGDTIEATLEFEQAGSVTIEAPVTDPTANQGDHG